MTGLFRQSQNDGFRALYFIFILNFLLFTLFGCSSEKKQILEGTFSHYEGKYAEATADFLNVINSTEKDPLSHQYALFDLSATYISLGELDAALDRLSELNLENKALPADFRSRAFYNTGIIFARKGDYKKAAKNFKRAVLSDSKNLDAKINLELCQRELVQKRAKSAEAEMQAVNEEKGDNSALENEIFNLIRENEGKKWRNMSESSEKNEDILDY